jgi:ATP-dependent RNA helicase DeaD
VKHTGEAIHGEAGDQDELQAAPEARRGESFDKRSSGSPGGARSKGERFAAETRDGTRPPKRRKDNAMVRLVIAAGEQRGIRPKDLVGAIAGEADIPGSSIGAIEIGERHSIVEVPEAVAEKVIRALSKATLKGQRVTAKREK